MIKIACNILLNRNFLTFRLKMPLREFQVREIIRHIRVPDDASWTDGVVQFIVVGPRKKKMIDTEHTFKSNVLTPPQRRNLQSCLKCVKNASNYCVVYSVTSKKLPNVYKSFPKNDFTRKIKDFDKFTK